MQSAEERRQTILAYLRSGVPDAVKRFDKRTGRFLAANGGWAVTMQDIVFPLALLYRTDGLPPERLSVISSRTSSEAVTSWNDPVTSP